MGDRRCDLLSMQMGEALETAMRERETSAYRLARHARIAENTIAHVLDGHSARTSTLAALAETLGLRWVISLESIPAPPGAPERPALREGRSFQGALNPPPFSR